VLFKYEGLSKSTQIQNSSEYVKKHEEDLVKSKLFSLYGVTRGHSDNPFEIYDHFSLEVNDSEIITSNLQMAKE